MIKEKAKKTVKKKSKVPAKAGKPIAHLKLTLYETGMHTDAHCSAATLATMISVFVVENPEFADTIHQAVRAHPVVAAFMKMMENKN